MPSMSMRYSLVVTGTLALLSLRKKSISMITQMRGARREASFPSSIVPRHEYQPLEQMHVLFVLEQRAVQRRDDGLLVLAAQGFGRDVVGEQELQPVEQLGSRRFLLQSRHFAHFEEHLQRLAQQMLLDAGKVYVDDFLHRLLVREADVMEEAAPQERVGQLFFVVGGDEH